MWRETFEKELLMPELAMIRFVVFDEDVGSRDDFIGQFSLPFSSVRPGMLLYLSLLYCLKYWRSNGIKSYDIRELKQQRRRRLRKRHLKLKWIRATLNFIGLIPPHSIRQMLANFSGVEF